MSELKVRPNDSLVSDLPPAPRKRLRARKDGSVREKRSIYRVRNALAKMLEENASQYQEWFVKAAEKDPIKALVLMKDLAEYFMPRLGRIEQTGTVEHKVSHFVPLIEREERPALNGECEEVQRLS